LTSNVGVDDLLEEAEELSVEVRALESWRLLRQGHQIASQGRWDEAHDLVVKGEEILGGSPSSLAWTSIGIDEDGE
jgi:hypothetical protein